MFKKWTDKRWVRTTLLLSAAVVAVPAVNVLAEQLATKMPTAEIHKPSLQPDRIVLTWEGDTATTQAVTWRTDVNVNSPQAQIAVASDNSDFEDDAVTVPAESTSEVATYLGYSQKYHSVNFENLSPETTYLYRVGDGVNWSEWFEFTTASDQAKPFSFLYVGDAQNDILEHWSRVIRNAYSDLPDASFIVHAGDLINHGDADDQWGEWFKAGGWLNGMVPSIPTPGNHEYARISNETPAGLSPYWRPTFALPENGPDEAVFKENVYYVDYQGMRIVSLDTNLRGENLDKQVAWLDQTLKSNPNEWTVLTFHHPIFSSAEGRDNAEVRNKLLPIIQKYNVDLVLQGHDHTYARGQVLNQKSGKKVVDPDSTTVFVNSVSGPKMYESSSEVWDKNGAQVDKAVANTQLYQLIHVDGNVLRYDARTATGKAFDEFEIRKLPNGKKQMIEKKK
ncbi:purple acid phosphatase family protein [Paenibacillus arenilitoris]|uniref:Metallophosphoesterase family protein n=1 Tax=Paenibacillus arenilitoris TaxID=2772299 RepID=A0A927CMK8_9BACL|nr:metallophosphoesterase family protein [Paenibacillus arenilitoris]MBD2870027.1 metallophosphoesterase family protein [Paenibacillus arenilitoris]